MKKLVIAISVSYTHLDVYKRQIFNGTGIDVNSATKGMCDDHKWLPQLLYSGRLVYILDPEQNVRVGADLLSELLSKEKGTEWALMAYNGGEAFADRFVEQGSISDYAARVLEYREEILTYSQEEKNNKF